MATGGDSSVADSDIYYEFSCSLCAENGRNVEAIKRCEDCVENLCGECLTNHNRFKAMREHTLVDQDEIGQTKHAARLAVPRVKCKRHHGNNIELYCGNHDVVGCGTCINLSHRLCEDMHYIPEAASGIKDTTEQKSVEDSIDALIKRTTLLKQTREDYLKRITTKRNDGVQLINERMQVIRKRLDELKEKAITEIEETVIEREEAVMAEISKTADVISKLKDGVTHLKAAQRDESILFIYMKQEKAEQKEREKLVQELERSVCSDQIDNVVDEIVLACLTEVETCVCVKPVVSQSWDRMPSGSGASLSLEQTPNISSFSPSLEHILNVRTDDDSKVCEIYGTCLLDNGNMIMTDVNNSCVKLFDSSYRLLDRSTLKAAPSALCLVRDWEVAIALFDRGDIKFATVDQMICLTRSFTVGERCRGISYASERLYVCCGGKSSDGEGAGQVRVFDLDGILLQTIMPHGRREYTLSIPMNIITAMNGDLIVSNKRKGIIAFNKSGKVVWYYQDCSLSNAIGICEIDDDVVLVCCLDSGNLFEVMKTDQRSRIVLHGSNILKEALSLTYNKPDGKLIITRKECDRVFVFNIK